MRLTELLFSKIGKYSKDFSNLPDRYIKRAMEQVEWRNPKGIQYKPNTVIKRKNYKFGLDRPWTAQFRQENSPGIVHEKIFVEPIKKWSFFRGDRVEVLVGKDKGKQGLVKQIVQERNWVTIDGLNCVLEKVGGSGKFPGIYIQKEKPLLVTTQVALVDPSDFQATEFEWRFTEEGDEVRVSKRTGRIIPVPASAEETIDYKMKGAYKEQPKDTLAKDASEITFQPQLKTFAMDVMDSMGIEEDRVPPKYYWY